VNVALKDLSKKKDSASPYIRARDLSKGAYWITESPSISAAEVFYRTFCISVYCRLPCVCVKKKISSRVQSFKKHIAGKNKKSIVQDKYHDERKESDPNIRGTK